MPFFAYILRNPEGRYYIGQTSDLTARLQRHNEGDVFWTKGRGPWLLVYWETFANRGDAVRRERHLKRLRSRVAIERLVTQGTAGQGLRDDV
ncbi:MAG: GIY-YIG nuclease family protein [Chloroflexi bacterium]|nr:GIY-YIG nuclease family protein [Chloroflexota bacterium]